MFKAMLVVILFTADPTEFVRVQLPLDSYRDCVEVSKMLEVIPQVADSTCLQPSKTKAEDTNYGVEQGI